MLTLRSAILAVVILASAPAQPDVQISFPKDGNGLLDYCGPVVAAFDSPSVVIGSAESHGIQMMKQGWCAGHLQAMREMILFSQVQQVKTVASLSGEKNPEQTLTPDVLRQVMAKNPEMTCIPNEVNQAQLARILVKWLRDHPERLHEPDYLLAFNGLTPAVDHHLSRRTRSRHLGNQLPHLRQVRLSGTIHPAVFKFGQTQISYWRTISEWEGHRPTAQRYL